jgi:hypothetical protein
VILSLGFVIGGGLLLYASGLKSLSSRTELSAFFSQLGGLLLATGLITFAWDLVGRRAFADEVLAKAKLSTDVVESGLTRVTDQYLEDVEWADLFRDVNKLDIVVAYGSTWRNTHGARLEAAAARPDCRIRVFLPHPKHAQTMAVLADRFHTTPEQLAPKVEEAIRDFRALARPGGATVEVYLREGDLVFSCYRFDSRAVLTIYTHSRERRTHVPTFVMDNGSLFQFVYDELAAIAQQSQPAPEEET